MLNSTMRMRESTAAQLQMLHTQSRLWEHGLAHVTLTTTLFIPFGLRLPEFHTSQSMSCGMPACVMSLRE